MIGETEAVTGKEKRRRRRIQPESRTTAGKHAGTSARLQPPPHAYIHIHAHKATLGRPR